MIDIPHHVVFNAAGLNIGKLLEGEEPNSAGYESIKLASDRLVAAALFFQSLSGTELRDIGDEELAGHLVMLGKREPWAEHISPGPERFTTDMRGLLNRIYTGGDGNLTPDDQAFARDFCTALAEEAAN